jgi:hypothetical protein
MFLRRLWFLLRLLIQLQQLSIWLSQAAAVAVKVIAQPITVAAAVQVVIEIVLLAKQQVAAVQPKVNYRLLLAQLTRLPLAQVALKQQTATTAF